MTTPIYSLPGSGDYRSDIHKKQNQNMIHLTITDELPKTDGFEFFKVVKKQYAENDTMIFEDGNGHQVETKLTTVVISEKSMRQDWRLVFYEIKK